MQFMFSLMNYISRNILIQLGFYFDPCVFFIKTISNISDTRFRWENEAVSENGALCLYYIFLFVYRLIFWKVSEWRNKLYKKEEYNYSLQLIAQLENHVNTTCSAQVLKMADDACEASVPVRRDISYTMWSVDQVLFYSVYFTKKCKMMLHVYGTNDFLLTCTGASAMYIPQFLFE